MTFIPYPSINRSTHERPHLHATSNPPYRPYSREKMMYQQSVFIPPPPGNSQKTSSNQVVYVQPSYTHSRHHSSYPQPAPAQYWVAQPEFWGTQPYPSGNQGWVQAQPQVYTTGPTNSRTHHSSSTSGPASKDPTSGRNSNLDPDVDLRIHNALGWWPDSPEPALSWDLTKPERFKYKKRTLDSSELASSPFSHPVPYIFVTLEDDPDCRFGIQIPPGSSCFTLLDFFRGMAAIMHQPVPSEQFRKMSTERRTEIVRAWNRRTRSNPDGSGVLPTYNGTGMTHFLNMDLLGKKVMFLGLVGGDKPTEWTLKTTTKPR